VFSGGSIHQQSHALLALGVASDAITLHYLATLRGSRSRW
jgi:hypothetical protein